MGGRIGRFLLCNFQGEHLFSGIFQCGSAVHPSWLSANTLSLDPKTICVEINELGYIEQLNKLGFEVVPLHYASSLAFGGSFHCSTVDVYREGGCEDYFPNQIPGY